MIRLTCSVCGDEKSLHDDLAGSVVHCCLCNERLRTPSRGRRPSRPSPRQPRRTASNLPLSPVTVVMLTLVSVSAFLLGAAVTQTKDIAVKKHARPPEQRSVLGWSSVEMPAVESAADGQGVCCHPSRRSLTPAEPPADYEARSQRTVCHPSRHSLQGRTGMNSGNTP